MIITIFIILQAILLLLMTLHDWIHFPPLTNIRDIEQQSSFTGRIINLAICS